MLHKNVFVIDRMFTILKLAVLFDCVVSSHLDFIFAPHAFWHVHTSEVLLAWKRSLLHWINYLSF